MSWPWPERALMLVSDRRRLPAGTTLEGRAQEAALGGIDLVQVREKDLEASALAGLVAEIVRVLSGFPTRVLVNGRADIAEATGAWGVHLPEAGLPLAAVRRAFPRLAVGASRHTVEGVLQAEGEGADFVVLGPVFSTPEKEERSLGLNTLGEAASRVRIPLLAIGGIDPGNAASVWAAGASGLAAIRPFLCGELARTARALRGGE